MVPRPVSNVMDRSPHGRRLLLTAYNSVESTICCRAPAVCIYILAGVTAAGFLMVKKMLDEYCGGGRVGKQEETVRIHTP